MDTKTRVQICRLMEKIYNNPSYAELIKVSFISNNTDYILKEKGTKNVTE